ncbi:MAG: DUF2156 domain-containing protein [Clostridia bacterium]|jgi:hypothetical protein|nr:DUF2156 domain-containing protein [Clostridiales bacterium]
MIGFKRIGLEDKGWMEELIAVADTASCNQNFTNLFIWADVYNQLVARINDYLVVKGSLGDDVKRYLFPTGFGNIRPVIAAMLQDALDCGHEFVMMGLLPGDVELLEKLYKGSFEFKQIRGAFDYVYLLEKLILLPGRKLHAKRNHINFFIENNDWVFEPITPENLDECSKMNEEWYREKYKPYNTGLANERRAVEKCFENYPELGLEGGLLRVSGRIVAYTIGEPLNTDTYVIHIEKAFSSIRGAYQMINREFASFIKDKYPHMLYVNREEDMGDKGLRRAKLSYYPDRMIEKYTARYKGAV